MNNQLSIHESLIESNSQLCNQHSIASIQYNKEKQRLRNEGIEFTEVIEYHGKGVSNEKGVKLLLFSISFSFLVFFLSGVFAWFVLGTSISNIDSILNSHFDLSKTTSFPQGSVRQHRYTMTETEVEIKNKAVDCRFNQYMLHSHQSVCL